MRKQCIKEGDNRARPMQWKREIINLELRSAEGGKGDNEEGKRESGSQGKGMGDRKLAVQED
jgi:hypothetical protein